MKKVLRMRPKSLSRYAIHLALGLFLSSTAFANDRVINVFGLLATKPCELINSKIDIDFGSINPSEIMDNLTKAQDFEIQLDNCPSSNIQTKFVGDAIDNNQLLKISSSSAAKGIGIRLIDENNKLVIIGQNTSATTGIAGAIHKMKFKAQVAKQQNIQSVSDITEGIFTVTATYEISYN